MALSLLKNLHAVFWRAGFFLLRHWRKLVLVVLLFGSGLLLSWYLLPKPSLLPENLSYSRAVLDRDGDMLFLTLSADGKYRLPIFYEMLPAELITATLEMEDRRYFQHRGIDFRSLARATWGVISGQRKGGASTLTMQLARLRWNLPTKTLSGKALQMFRAIQLERHYSKQDILSAYYTLAPYGGNIEGATAASLRWCGKPVNKLTLRESASLSVLPQSPTRRKPRTEGNHALERAQFRLMTQLRANKGEPANPLDAEFQLKPYPFPKVAPHYCRRLLKKNPQQQVIYSSLHRQYQEAIESSISDFLTSWRVRGLDNASAILVHAPTREIYAYVGSANFWNDAIRGQIDGVQAKRSPGSTLKPFIYALGIDAGLIHPLTLQDDAPTRFGDYNPENSDRDFLGPIFAKDALRWSRNLPAIELANRLPKGGLETFLRQSGISLKRRDYGLALAIGAAEISMEDLANLYVRLSAPNNDISDAARWMTLSALKTKLGDRPDAFSAKTGTSSGFRDARACGVIDDWVLCVWIGHFDQRPMPGLFAHKTASPLLAQTITRLNLPRSKQTRPEDITDVAVCSVSGDLPNPHCPHRTTTEFYGGVSPITTCRVHREIYLDKKGKRVPFAEDAVTRRVCEFWSPRRLAAFQYAGFPRAAVPPLAGENTGPASVAFSKSSSLRIVSPQASVGYVIQASQPDRRDILLEADTGPETKRLYWFAGSQFIGSSSPATPLHWTPLSGQHLIRVVDEEGQSATVTINVQAIP